MGDRIEVSECSSCPLLTGTANFPRCDHPKAPKLCGLPGQQAFVPGWRPTWCPLRDGELVIAGDPTGG